MGKEIVCEGAQLKCSQGASGIKLMVKNPGLVNIEGNKVATNLDFSSLIPPVPPMCCNSKKHPNYLLTASAGSPVSPNPCTPKVVPWDPVSKSVGIKGSLKALHKDSKCKCMTTMFDGVLEVTDPGQTSTKTKD